MSKSAFFAALNRLRSSCEANYDPGDPEEKIALDYHKAVQAIGEGDINQILELQKNTDPAHIASAQIKVRICLAMESDPKYSELVGQLKLLERARREPGPYKIWVIDALCLENLAFSYDMDKAKLEARLTELYELASDAEFHLILKFSVVAGLLFQAQRWRDVTAMLKWSFILEGLAIKYQLSFYRFSLNHHNLYLAALNGDSEKLISNLNENDKIFEQDQAQAPRYLRNDDWLWTRMTFLSGLARAGNLTVARKTFLDIADYLNKNPLSSYRSSVLLRKILLAHRAWSTREVQRFVLDLPKEDFYYHKRALLTCQTYLDVYCDQKTNPTLASDLEKEIIHGGLMRSDLETSLQLYRLKYVGTSTEWWKVLHRAIYNAEVEHNPLECLQWYWLEFNGKLVENAPLPEILELLEKIKGLAKAGDFALDGSDAVQLYNLLGQSSGRYLKEDVFAGREEEREVGKGICRERLQTWPLKNYLEKNNLNIRFSPKPPAPTQELQKRLFEALLKESGRIVPKEKIVRVIWSEAYDPRIHDGRMQKLVAKLRDHLQHHGYSPEQILAIPGEGYCYADRPVHQKELSGASRDRAILEWVESRPADQWFTSADLSRTFGQSQRQSQRDIKLLEARGLIEVLGKAKAKKYRYKREGQKAA